MGHHEWSMEIEHHKWPSRKNWNSRMAKPWGISILSWRSRVVFNPVITSDDPINYIVIYSRNFHQVTWMTLCLKNSQNSNVSNEKPKQSKKNSRNSDGFLTLIISRIFWLTCQIPINGILKIHWLESNASNSNQWYT